MTMTLKQAQRIAGRVGARIRVVPDVATAGLEIFEITISGRTIKGQDGNDLPMLFTEHSPRAAAHCAVIRTGIHAQAVQNLCKKVYVEEDLLFDGQEIVLRSV
jgi:hypothetical protein